MLMLIQLLNVIFRMAQLSFYILGIIAFSVYLKRNGIGKR